LKLINANIDKNKAIGIATKFLEQYNDELSFQSAEFRQHNWTIRFLVGFKNASYIVLVDSSNGRIIKYLREK